MLDERQHLRAHRRIVLALRARPTRRRCPDRDPRAASNRSRTRRRCSGVTRSAHLAKQPGAGQRPAPLQRRGRHAERIGGVFDAEPGEVAQLDDARLLRIDLFEPRQRIVQRRQHQRRVRTRPRARRSSTPGSSRPIVSARRVREPARRGSAASIARRCRRSAARRARACRRRRGAGKPRAPGRSPGASVPDARAACTRRQAGAARRRRSARGRGRAAVVEADRRS